MESRFKLRTLERSAVAIASVVVVEVFLGLAVNSLAIISDGLHAVLDTFTTALLFVATRASLKPPDEEHMYGHEKFESIGGLIGGIALVGVALLIIYEAFSKIVAGQTVNLGIEYVGFIAIAYTFCIDIFRVSSFARGRKTESTTVKVGFYHALADMTSTLIAFLGFGLATLGFFYGDSLASVVLGVLLIFMSIRLIRGTGMELADTVPKDVAEKVREEIANTQGVLKYEALKIRRVGDKTFVRASIQVPDYLSVEEAHAVASTIEANIKNALGNADVLIHVEPLPPEMRTEKRVEKLATQVKGVEEAYEIEKVYSEGKLHIVLHAHVDPKLSVEEAHVIAEKIEKKISENLKEVEDVTVHMEPFDVKVRKGTAVDESEVRRIAQKTAESYQQALRIRSILAYTAGKKRYVNVVCSLKKQISIEQAHEIATRIEENVQERFSETVVTVHIEPG